MSRVSGCQTADHRERRCRDERERRRDPALGRATCVAIQRATGAGMRSDRRSERRHHDPPNRMRVPVGRRGDERGHAGRRAAARRGRRSRPHRRARGRASNGRPHTSRSSPRPPAARPAPAPRARAAAARRRAPAGPARGAIPRSGARARARAAAGVAAASGATPAAAASDVHSLRVAPRVVAAATPIRRRWRRRGARARRRRATSAGAKRRAGVARGAAAARVVAVAAADRWRRRTRRPAPPPSATACRGRTRRRSRVASARATASANGASTRTRGGGASPRRACASASGELGRQRAVGRRRVDRESAAVGAADEARGAGVARAPAPVGGRCGEVRLGDDPRDVRAVLPTMAASSDRAAIATRTRPSGACADDRDVMRVVGSGELVFEREAARRPRRATRGSGGSATLAMRTCDAASTTSTGPPAATRPERSPAGAHAGAGGIEERPGLRAIRRGRRGEQNAQHRHAAKAGERVHRRSLLDAAADRSLDDLPDDRRLAAAAAAQRARGHATAWRPGALRWSRRSSCC